MTIEKLMIPRYKVIATYPNSKFKVDDVLTEQDFEGNIWFAVERFGEAVHKDEINLYPHLFKYMAWYEKREVAEMPQFVCVGDKYYEVKWDKSGDVLFYQPTVTTAWLSMSIFGSITTPVTEKEYNEYLNKQKSQK